MCHRPQRHSIIHRQSRDTGTCICVTYVRQDVHLILSPSTRPQDFLTPTNHSSRQSGPEDAVVRGAGTPSLASVALRPCSARLSASLHHLQRPLSTDHTNPHTRLSRIPRSGSQHVQASLKQFNPTQRSRMVLLSHPRRTSSPPNPIAVSVSLLIMATVSACSRQCKERMQSRQPSIAQSQSTINLCPRYMDLKSM